ncbi:MAG: DUF2393 family protein [Campylobacterales bacterium]|nr:DUF2393 family protein [Campylobacterales bacterium]
MTQRIKSALLDFADSLHTYDYVFFASFATLYLLILLLAIVLRKQVSLSLFLVLLALVVIIAGPIFGYQYTHGKLYKTEISDLVVKKLEFSEALIIKGKLKNLGQQSFKKCTITASACKGATNFYEEMLCFLEPFWHISMVYEKELPVNETLEFKLVMEPFTYADDYNTSVKADCL